MPAMADELAKRRELRRRKILENSEGRLQKLLAHSLDDEAICERPITPPPPTRGVFVSKNVAHIPSQASVAISPFKNPDTLMGSSRDDPAPARSSRHLLRNLTDDFDFSTGDVSARSDQYEVENIMSKNVNVSEQLTERTQSVTKRESDPTITREVESKSAISFHRVRRVIIVALSFIVYFLIYLDLMQYIIGKSIIIPFILSEVGISIYGHFFMVIPSTKCAGALPSLLNGALILCGVPEFVVSRILHSYYFLAHLFEELSLFLFTIFVLHWVAQSV